MHSTRTPTPPRRFHQRLFTPLRHEMWLPRLVYRSIAYTVVAAANAAGWVTLPWLPLVALAALTTLVLIAVAVVRPAPDGVMHALAPLPDVGFLYLVVANVDTPEPWVGLMYVWVAGLAFNTYARNTALLIPTWGLLAYVALLAAVPPDASLRTWALGHGLSVGLLTVVAFSYVRERTDLRLDGLTGVLERRIGLETLEALTYRPEPFHLAFVDLRDFKAINDAHGHAVGDEVLAAVGRRLRHAVRSEDPVLRFGGDEFLVASRHGDLAPRLRTALAGPVRTSAGPVTLHADVGVETWQPGDSLEALLREADARMYDHKRGGAPGLSSRAPESGPG